MNKLLAIIAAIIVSTSPSTAAAPSELSVAELQPVTYAEVEPTRDFESSFSSKKVEQPKASGQAAPVITDKGDYYEITVKVTEYCGCNRCGGSVDRKGNPLQIGTVAFSTKYGFKYGQRVEWNGKTYYVRDTGCATGTMDLYIGGTDHSQCDTRWLNQTVKVYK